MWPDRVSNPGPLALESNALLTALPGPASASKLPKMCFMNTRLHDMVVIQSRKYAQV